MTKKRQCTQFGLAKKMTLEQNAAKKSTNTQTIKFRQAPNACIFTRNTTWLASFFSLI
jgi:hypothetical protein